MAFRGNPEVIGRSTPRSVSNGAVPGPFFRRPQFDGHMAPPRRVHLISSDLWEAMTGERLSPASICQILDSAIPQGDSQAAQSLQHMQYVFMAKNKQGSRMIQDRLDKGSEQERMLVLNSLLPNLNELVYDPSANFVVQKMCEYLNPEQQGVMLSFFLKQKDMVIEHPNGCRVLQKFIESTTREIVDQLFLAVKDNLVRLCFSQNGNHIVQRFVETLPHRVGEMIQILQPRVVNLVEDNYGCRVVQRLFDKFDIDQLEPLVKVVLANAVSLATNQYGNYVVQNILEAGKREHVDALIAAFRGRFYDFSIHKFASNVIEKCIRGATDEQRCEIFSEIIEPNGRIETSRILKMVGDQFGNYVIQRIIEYGTRAQIRAIYDVVDENYDLLTTTAGNYAKHVVSYLNSHAPIDLH